MKFKVLTTKAIQHNITDFNLVKFQYLVKLALKLHLENLEHYLSGAIPYHKRVFIFRKKKIVYCFKTIYSFLKYYLYY